MLDETLPAAVAIVGGGLIGGGWAARFAMNGILVQVFDPDPDAQRKMSEILSNARRATEALLGSRRPAEGELSFCSSIEEAVAGVAHIQESAPEQLALKQKILAEIDQFAAPECIVGTSTSGLLPTQLQRDMRHPDRFMVCHPFNPVYLLPLVELVAGEQTDPANIDRAAGMYEALGMRPLKVRKEIDAFIADRLMEALWREALWLVKDGVATAEEVDDAIRFGCGLRWAQMGTFQTFDIAGGEAGMRHFMAQFGPALKWPWTKLMDTPEMTDELIELIAGQVEQQADGLDYRQLERIRDDNLVGIMRALEKNSWGAGQTLKEYEQRLDERAATTGEMS